MSDILEEAKAEAASMRRTADAGDIYGAGTLELVADLIDRLAAELAKAREALTLIAEPLDGCPDVPKYYDSVRAFEIARAALAAKGADQ